MLKNLKNKLVQKIDDVIAEKMSSQMSRNFEGHTLHKLQSNTKSLYEDLYGEETSTNAQQAK